MSRKGDCWDNAVAESFFGSLKTERVFGSTYTTRGEARRDLFDYIEMFYNCRRRHSFINNKSPQKWEMEKAA
jgi:putative transposase